MTSGTAAALLFALLSLAFILSGLRGRLPGQRVKHAAPSSKLGIVIQGAAIGLVFAMRPGGTPLFHGGWFVPPELLARIAVVLGVSGAVLAVWGQRTLGRHWSVSARVLHGHRLVTTGPYAYVRHPLYLGMLLFLVAAGLAETTPAVVAVAIGLYLVGFAIRTRAEEQLMRETFGEEWERYRNRVPALFPFGRGL
jgi:protein-S-isoprenylcysteine O-methyltransferase Ste14